MFYTQLCISRHRELNLKMNFDLEIIGLTEPMLYPFGSLKCAHLMMGSSTIEIMPCDRLMEIVYGTEVSI